MRFLSASLSGRSPMKSKLPAGPASRWGRRAAIGALFATLSLASMTIVPASATDVVYLDGNLQVNSYYSTPIKNALTGGRVFHTGSAAILRTETRLNGVLKYAAEGINGGAADMTHGSVYSGTERCRWVPLAGGGISGSIWIICKYRY